jgi:uncharacterized protein (TIGR00369 family)
VSGPTLFMLSDLAAYAVILAHIGRVALAVTTNLNINFLKKPQPGPLDATAMILKLGKRLVVTDISIRDSGGDFGGACDSNLFHPATKLSGMDTICIFNTVVVTHCFC